MAILDDDVARVRAATDLVAVASEHVALRKVGRRWTGLCPFHAERTPSFSVNAEEGLYYCLGPETRVLTWDGVKPIRDLAGTVQRVLTERGQWVDAPFYSFGVQPLMRIVLGRGGQRKAIRATPEHRWFVRDTGRGTKREVLTRDLRPGHSLAWSFPQNRVVRGVEPSPFGIARGITYGDGSRFAKGACVDLHGEKDAQLLKWFPLNRTLQCTSATGKPYTKVVDLPAYFKDRPPLDESASYLYGWLAGYLAADGHVAKDGTVSLNSAERGDLEFVRLLCTRLGIGTYGITEQRRVGLGQDEPSSLYRVHFITEDLTEDFFLVSEHRLRFAGSHKAWTRRGWVVESVEPTDDVEEVFCAVVDGTHSFTLEDNVLTSNCFGCGAKGDAITFVREVEHLDFVGAVEKLAAKAGIQLREADAAATRDRRRRARLLEALEAAVAWYHERLLTAPDAAPARAYLRGRGYDGEAVRAFRLGWAPDDWDALAKALALPEDVLRDTGLGFVNKAGRRQDAFRARVMFPIFDPAGAAVAFGGRVLPGANEPRAFGANEPKYKNSPETPVYAKRRTLYGLNWAKAEVVRSGEVVVCEGYTDVIGFFRAGLPRAVATCGTALAEEHFRLLKNFARRVVLAYDADAAGQAAAERFYEWERRYDVDVAVAALPAGSDPGELAQRDPDALRAAVAGARPFLEFRLERVLGAARLDSPEGRARAAEAAVAVVREHPSDLVRDQYLMRVADRTRTGPDQLRALVRARRPEAPPARPAPPPASPTGGRDAAEVRVERAALRLAVAHPEVRARLDEMLFANEVHAGAFRALSSAVHLHEAIDGADPEAAALLQRLAVEDATEEPDDVLARLAERAARRLLADLPALARSSEERFADLAPVSGWLASLVEALQEPAVRGPAVDQLVAWLSERHAEAG